MWKEHALIWGAIIAVSQVADALRDVIPVTKRYKAAAEHTVALDSLFIDAQLEWESIFSGRFTNEQIISRLHKLRKLQLDAEAHTFKEGLPQRGDLFRAAEQQARLFFKNTYAVD